MYLSFDDVLIEPQCGRVDHRGDISLLTEVAGTEMQVPIISASMSSVTETAMALAMDAAGSFGVIHRFMTIDEQVKMYTDISHKKKGIKVFCAIGIREGLERVNRLREIGCNNFCLDVAHAYSLPVMDFLETLPLEINLIVGNVATAEAVIEISAYPNVDAIKVGIGPGAACITRQVTGVGVPQLSAIMECYEPARTYGLDLIADGGIRTSGDIVKAIVAGADAVMVGYLLAGADEAPLTGKYFGMASAEVDGYNTSVPEGVSGSVLPTGPVANTIEALADGIRSGISYAGGDSLRSIQGKHELFIQVTSTSLAESRARI
jgi:IMP dehydrogenase